ncbi:hypothetical protein [Mesorhizobium sp. B2-3-4]|uniref:hypothetical protein n=1 Tax=Mesorhizobium sp. B2-3-4 TaxID=2589959 RepID=UPI001127692B|nr:hypothetical protein [Mesorhizobium sp. B2-3-4]TPM41388.1 hypothetical protein FJ967_00175 [Mesorhizobium sp. B2-3-4]
MPTDNTNLPERLELPNGHFITLEGDYSYVRGPGYEHIVTLDKYGTQNGHQRARAFAAAMAPQDGLREALEHAAKVADEFTKHTCRDERSRFTLADMQAMMRTTARAIAADIRALAATPAAQQAAPAVKVCERCGNTVSDGVLHLPAKSDFPHKKTHPCEVVTPAGTQGDADNEALAVLIHTECFNGRYYDIQKAAALIARHVETRLAEERARNDRLSAALERIAQYHVGGLIVEGSPESGRQELIHIARKGLAQAKRTSTKHNI